MTKVVVATTLDDACRVPVSTAIELAARLGGELTVLGSVPELAPGAAAWPGQPALELVEAWVADMLPAGATAPRVAARGGLPGVEIPRFAEEVNADLLVIGRGDLTGAGDLADTVLRRSRKPCLVLPCHWQKLLPILVALDGSERGFQVHQAACELAERMRVPVRSVTVDPLDRDGQAAGPSARSLRLLARVQALAGGGHGSTALKLASPPLHIRAGDVVREVLAEVAEVGAGILAVGWRWGGPSDRIPTGSVGRRLALEAPCGVLAIPL
jgi:nucleotide-binding universal stress UspA family protein